MDCANEVVARYCTAVGVETRWVEDLVPCELAAGEGCSCYGDKVGVSFGGSQGFGIWEGCAIIENRWWWRFIWERVGRSLAVGDTGEMDCTHGCVQESVRSSTFTTEVVNEILIYMKLYEH